MSELVIKVDGMHCGGCERAVERVVMKVRGVSSVRADHRRGTVTVGYNGEEPSRAEIHQAISRAGYKPAAGEVA